jgi:hypothetical protein
MQPTICAAETRVIRKCRIGITIWVSFVRTSVLPVTKHHNIARPLRTFEYTPLYRISVIYVLDSIFIKQYRCHRTVRCVNMARLRIFLVEGRHLDVGPDGWL